MGAVFGSGKAVAQEAEAAFEQEEWNYVMGGSSRDTDGFTTSGSSGVVKEVRRSFIISHLLWNEKLPFYTVIRGRLIKNGN